MEEKIGVFVSESRFSQIAFDQIKEMGFSPVVFSFKKTSIFSDEIILDFGDIDSFIKHAEEQDIKKFVFAGKIEASSLFNNKISQSGKKFLERIEFIPENILKNLTNFFVKKGIEIIPLTKVFKKFIAKEKIYTKAKPDKNQWKEICSGYKIAKSIARLGIGQAVAIKNGMVIAVEAIEGTDAMIKRAGEFCKDFSVIKVIKTSQDVRFDMPTIGPETIKNMVLSRARVLAVEAGKTIIIEQEKLSEIANRNNIVIVGFRGKEISNDCETES